MKKRKAFTLTEIIVSMILIAALSIAALELLIFYFSFISRSETRLIAANFARETMERLYMNDYNSLAAVTNESDPLPAEGDFGVLSDRYGGSRYYSIAGKPDYKTITVTVRWTR